MSSRVAKSSAASFSDIQAVPGAILVPPADSTLRFSQLEFEAVMYVDYNILFFRNVTPFSLVGMYGLYGETWKLRDTFLYALTEGGRFVRMSGTCTDGRTATQNTCLILLLLSGNLKTFTSGCVNRSAISLRS